jgi:hypothetical protein
MSPVEQLEDRLVLSITDLTQLALLFPAHSGPTHLYLNFDGWHDTTHSIAAFSGTNQDIQEILFRTAEIYAPFDVQVSRMFGDGIRDQSSNGNTTIFIGANSANVDPTGAKYPYAFTPWYSEDYPGINKGDQHQPNSDLYDVAWVDPVGQKANSTSWITVWSDAQISRYVAHEAGHTFGLAHTLTGSTSDLMSYDAPEQFFANHTFSITDLNFNGTQTVSDPTQQPEWQGTAIITQNSFTYLQAVLGPRPSDGTFHVADTGVVDPGLQAIRPLASTLSVGSNDLGSIHSAGDYDVYRFDSSATESIHINLLPTRNRALIPVLLIHDKSGNLIQLMNGTWNASFGDYEVHSVLPFTAGQSYFLVVGSENGTASSGSGSYDLSIDVPTELIGRALQSGQLWVGSTSGSSFACSMLATWNTAVTWVDVVTGDFNGDGKTDLAGRSLQTGQWWVALSNGTGFTSTLWTTWSTGVTWTNVKVGDFNGDGKMDIAGRALESGQWWVARSTGTSFANSLWATWNTTVTWVDVSVGDFTGDGKADIAGQARELGQWWVAQSNGASFTNRLWATWSTGVTWADVNTGDFNGDKKTDIVGRALNLGQWWIGLSTGTSFASTLWTIWNTAVTWVDIKIGDFNGDGNSDIIGRVQQSGQWWVAYSNGASAFANVLFASWNPAVHWVDVQVGDFNADGRDDITARDLAAGNWWTSLSNGTTGVTSLWATWNTGIAWVDVRTGL